MSSLFSKKPSIKTDIANVIGFRTRKINLYLLALAHRSSTKSTSENNERMEFLGDAILGSAVANYLFKKYPYKDEGFLTEMRSKMVNRQKLNEVALKMGIKKIASYNKFDHSLRTSQIFGNTLEALVGAVFLDKGYDKTCEWINNQIIKPYMFINELEDVEINIKNRLYGWASKNGMSLDFDTIDEKLENGRRLFTIGAKINGEVIAEGKAFNKKDASQIATVKAIETLGI